MIPCSHFSCFSRAVISMSMPCFPAQLYVLQIYLAIYLYLTNGPPLFFVISSLQGLRIASQAIYWIISPSFKDSLLCTSRQPVSTPIGVAAAHGGSVETQDSLFELLLLPGGGTPCFCCLVPSCLFLCGFLSLIGTYLSCQVWGLGLSTFPFSFLLLSSAYYRVYCPHLNTTVA